MDEIEKLKQVIAGLGKENRELKQTVRDAGMLVKRGGGRRKMNCKTTHYQGCDCHEENHRKEIAQLSRIIEGLRKEIDERRQAMARIRKAFGHTHVAGNDGTDTCSGCGLDLRNEIHDRND